MENNKIIDLDKKVEELKKLIEKRKTFEHDDETNQDLGDIFNYDIKKELTKNIEIVKKMRLLYIILFIITLGFFVFNLLFPFKEYKEITIYKDKPDVLKIENNKNINIIEEDNTYLLLESKDKSSLRQLENNISDYKEDLSIEKENIYNQELIENTLDEKQKNENIDIGLIKNNLCTGNTIVNINIHLRKKPGKTNEKIAILFIGDEVEVLNCGVDLLGEKWYKVKTIDGLEGWISQLGIPNYIDNNIE